MDPGDSMLILFSPPGRTHGCHFVPLSQISTCSREPSPALLLSYLLEGKRSDHTAFLSVLAAGLGGKGQNLHYWAVPFLRHEIEKE